MRKLALALGAAAMTLPAMLPAAPAEAQTRHTYHRKVQKHKVRHYKKCRHSPGTAGLVAGGVVGVLAAPAIIGGGVVGAVAGGAGGALGGRAIDRTLTAKYRCR